MTDPEARLARKGPGREAKLAYSTHGLMENRNGLLIDLVVSTADGFAERREGAKLISKLAGSRRKTVGADKGYDATDFVEACRQAGVTPHVAPTSTPGVCARRSIDARHGTAASAPAKSCPARSRTSSAG